MAENNVSKKIDRVFGVFVLFKLVLALFAWWGRDPEAPVVWGELRWIFLIEFMILAYILYKLHLANYAFYG